MLKKSCFLDSAVQIKHGAFVTGNRESTETGRTALTTEQKKAYDNHNGNVIIVHNHPNGSRPSYTDISTLSKVERADATVAVGHDGSVFIISGINREFDVDKYYQKAYNILVNELGNKEVAEIRATDMLYDAGIFDFKKR